MFEGSNEPSTTETSAEQTALVAGVSPPTVKRIRNIYADPIAMQEVDEGASIYAAAERARTRTGGTGFNPKVTGGDYVDAKRWWNVGFVIWITHFVLLRQTACCRVPVPVVFVMKDAAPWE